jgi:hypothetical protein
MGKAYLFVEGHGEVRAAGNLVTRLSIDLGLPLVWTPRPTTLPAYAASVSNR